MGSKDLSMAIVGEGMGGSATAGTLSCVGLDVTIYERARRSARIGAGIQTMPSSSKAVRPPGVEERLRATAFEPHSHLNRQCGRGRGPAGAPHARHPHRRPLSWNVPLHPPPPDDAAR